MAAALVALCQPCHQPDSASLAQLAAPVTADQLLAAELTLQALPDLLPLPYLPCIDAPRHIITASQLVQRHVSMKSTSCQELYLDWLSTAAAADWSAEREVAALAEPKHVCTGFKPGAAVLLALRSMPSGLHGMLDAARTARLRRSQALTAPSEADLTSQTAAKGGVSLRTAAEEAKHNAAPAAPAQRAGLGFLTGLQKARHAELAPVPGKPAASTGQQTGAEVLSASLPELHIGLLLQLRKCDAQALQMSAGLPTAVR